MWSRMTEHAIGSNWGISVVVTAHFTAGYASEVTSIRLCQVIKNYEDIEDDARPSLPPYLAAMVLSDPDSAATLRKVGAVSSRHSLKLVKLTPRLSFLSVLCEGSSQWPVYALANLPPNVRVPLLSCDLQLLTSLSPVTDLTVSLANELRLLRLLTSEL